jgi:hypothetical protein
MQKVSIPLNTGEQDKLYLVAGGVIYEVPIPEFGNLEGVIADGKIVDLGIKNTFRVPGRSRRKR